MYNFDAAQDHNGYPARKRVQWLLNVSVRLTHPLSTA